MILKTDPKFVINDDDQIELDDSQIVLDSDFWVFNPGDGVKYTDQEEGRNVVLTGEVIGFNNYTQIGRIMYVKTGKDTFIYLDKLTHLGEVQM